MARAAVAVKRWVVALAFVGCTPAWHANAVRANALDVSLVDVSEVHGSALHARVRFVNRGGAVVEIHPERAMAVLPDGNTVRAVVPAEPRPVHIAPATDDTATFDFALTGGAPQWSRYPSVRIDFADAVALADGATVTLPQLVLEHAR